MLGFSDITWLMINPCGVYLLYQDNVLVYVGSSVDIPRRISEHRKDRQMLFNRVECKFCCSVSEAKRLEKDLIYEHHPTMNVTDRAPTDIPTGFVVDLAKLGVNVVALRRKINAASGLRR